MKRASYYTASRLTILYFSLPNLCARRQRNQIVVLYNIPINGVESPVNRTQCGDSSYGCELVAGYEC